MPVSVSECEEAFTKVNNFSLKKKVNGINRIKKNDDQNIVKKIHVREREKEQKKTKKKK